MSETSDAPFAPVATLDDLYTGPAADARAAAIEATLGTDAETLTDTVWLMRYRTVKFDIQWPTHEELLELRSDD